MLAPKKTKHRKHHQIKPAGVSTRGTEMSFGSYGLKALESRWVTARQIEATRRVITKYIQRGGKMWIRIFPDMVITKKSGEIPMGKGKGAPDHFVAIVKRGRILLELEGVTEAVAKEAIHLAMYKLPIKCAFIKK
ncbi:50S ribosomal protein L16 [Candidatus Falkowbacteria bacterium RIFOXYC2_FULL_47_12]|uniref:Large ribosomal subunit protein uL16 n=2 Tax=Candidatus Falkowiibacteriota TaxID=1752728 RepID=A0A1F5TN61_9BACT|nr:MAG: 50S ribosomal protein L16 [Candidatus Falkowbacteria bacterium RIFOXYA2_FULL_47_9]OGF40287.1 MAG: 50S ribosomal protein L16 [Candidatus Falkowbacteria bacterium RIFOXYC2_FULL_47_12]